MDAFVYLEDIVIFGSTQEEQNLIKNNGRSKQIRIKIPTWQMWISLAKIRIYLEHVVIDKGVKPNSLKIHGVKNFKILKNVTEVVIFRVSRILLKIY